MVTKRTMSEFAETVNRLSSSVEYVAFQHSLMQPALQPDEVPPPRPPVRPLSRRQTPMSFPRSEQTVMGPR